MEIKLVKVVFDSQQKNRNVIYKYESLEWCCDELKYNQYFNITKDDLTMFDMDEKLYGYPDVYNDIPQICMTIEEEKTSYDDSWTVNYNYPIKFCPYCGKPITISINKEINLSNIYKNLVDKKESLKKKKYKTDSIRREEKLSKEIRELDKKINWFYYTTKFNLDDIFDKEENNNLV